MRDELRKLSLEEKIQYTRRLYISYPRLDSIMKSISDCHKQDTSTDLECLFIKGIAGVGKSTIRIKYETQFPRRITDKGMIVPVLSASAPVPATLRNLACRLLESLGDPEHSSGTIYKLTSRLHNLIKDCGVELIILDEFQHFIDCDSSRPLLKEANWLKDLINETNVPIVLIGMPVSECIFNSKDQYQLSRRFKIRKSLEPFSWTSEESQNEFRRLLKGFADSLPIDDCSIIWSKNMAFRILYATDGVIDHIRQLIKSSCILALKNGRTRLDEDLLSVVFNEKIKSILGWKIDPFREELHSLKDRDPSYKEPCLSKARKKVKSMGEILVTK